MIADCLGELGDTVIQQDVHDPPAIPPGVDLVWHYGDQVGIPEYAALCAERNIPLLINSVYDGGDDRAKAIVEQLRGWDRAGRGAPYLAVFSDAARLHPAFAPVRGRVVCIPKTIRTPPRRTPPFSGRRGICVGERAKTFGKPRITRGLDVPATIAAVRRRYPKVELWTYQQYGDQASVPEGVRVKHLQPSGFTEWLGQFRLYVSLVRHETFAMVPAEAQGSGTPVLYRPMPQSLSPHLNTTGLSYDTTQELVDLIGMLYDDEALWTRLSASGRFNAAAHAVDRQASVLHVQLRRLVVAHAR